MTDIATWLGQQLDEDEEIAHLGPRTQVAANWSIEEFQPSEPGAVPAATWVIDDQQMGVGQVHGDFVAAHIARHDPARVLRDVVAKRAILAEVASWRHDYVDGDSWLSCAQAVDPHDEEGVSGSGCADDARRGGPCECGLERRRNAILYPLARPYDDRPGYKEEWRP